MDDTGSTENLDCLRTAGKCDGSRDLRQLTRGEVSGGRWEAGGGAPRRLPRPRQGERWGRGEKTGNVVPRCVRAKGTIRTANSCGTGTRARCSQRGEGGLRLVSSLAITAWVDALVHRYHPDD